MTKTYLAHHGIKGQRWGVRRFQNDDGSLTPAGIRRYQKLDERWVKRKSDKVYDKAMKESRTEMSDFVRGLQDELIKKSQRGEKLVGFGKMSMINKYNAKLAEVMRTKTKDIRSPSGKVVEWVAKRGNVGVHMALADQGYDMDKLKRGVWSDGRIAYRTKKVDMTKTKGGG